VLRLFAAAVAIAGLSAPGIARAGEGSIYEVDPFADGALIFAGGAATFIPYLLEDELIVPTCPCDQAAVHGIDRDVIGNRSPPAYAFSTLVAGLAIAAPFAVEIAEVGRSPILLESFLVYAETLAFTAAAVSITKHLFPRPLPLVYDDPSSALAEVPEGYRAFYSGHVANTTAMMTALAMTSTYRHGSGVWPWLLDLLFTGVVSAGVIASGRHFYSDVIAGVSVGFVTGVTVPLVHRLLMDEEPR
jgi:membrane-associated phospholipid phosphatase